MYAQAYNYPLRIEVYIVFRIVWYGPSNILSKHSNHNRNTDEALVAT